MTGTPTVAVRPARARLRAAAALVALLGAASAAGMTGTAHAADDVYGPPSPVADHADVVLPTLTSVSPSVLTPGATLTLRLGYTAGSTGAAGVSTTVAVTTAPLTTTAAVDAFLAAPTHADVRVVDRGVPGQSAGGTLAAQGTSTLTFTLDPTLLALDPTVTGVYGLTLTTRAAGMEPFTQALVVGMVSTPPPTLNVAVVATVTGAPGRVESVMAAATDSRISLAVDPLALGAMENPPALRGRDVFALPGGHVDVASAVHDNALGVLDFAVSRTQASAWANAPLMMIPAVIDDAVVTASVERGAAAALAGTRLETPLPDAAHPLATPVVPVAAEAGTLPVVSAHARLSRVLADTPPSQAEASARMAAEALLVALEATTLPEGTTPTVVIAPGDQWIVDGTTPSSVVAALFSQPWVHPVSLTQVLATAPAAAVTAPPAQPHATDAPQDQLAAVQQALGRIDTLAGITDAPGTMLTTSGHPLLASLSLPLRATPDARQAAVTAALEEAAVTLDAVRVTSSSEVTLVSASGKVPLTVRNDLPYAVTVVVAMTSRSPHLLITEQPVVVLPAHSEQTVLVPITAVSSDDVRVSVALRTEQGSTVSVAKTVTVRVRAEWGNAATGVATAGLVLLLVAGVVRTIRRGRRDTRMAPGPDDAPSPASESDA